MVITFFLTMGVLYNTLLGKVIGPDLLKVCGLLYSVMWWKLQCLLNTSLSKQMNILQFTHKQADFCLNTAGLTFDQNRSYYMRNVPLMTGIIMYFLIRKEHVFSLQQFSLSTSTCYMTGCNRQDKVEVECEITLHSQFIHLHWLSHLVGLRSVHVKIIFCCTYCTV